MTTDAQASPADELIAAQQERIRELEGERDAAVETLAKVETAMTYYDADWEARVTPAATVVRIRGYIREWKRQAATAQADGSEGVT